MCVNCARVFFEMMKRSIALMSLASFVLLQSCGGGGGGGAAAEEEETPATTQNVSGGGVKGPLAFAIVNAYTFDATQPNLRSATPVATGTTDAAASIVGLALPVPLDAPYVLEFTSDVNTRDITTNAVPVISTMRTVLTTALLASGENIYATPLTTMAVDVAIQNADSAIAPYTSVNDGTVTKAEFLAALNVAAAQVVSTLGFGIDSSVDIFDTPPLIDSTTDTTAEQTAVAAYRTAVEALTAMAYELGQNSAATPVSADEMLAALTADLSDGGIIDGSVVGSPIDATVLNDLITIDPNTLPIPNSAANNGGVDIVVGDVEQVLVSETTTTGTTTSTTELEPGGSISVDPAPAETNPSQDGDVIPDSSDNCPLIANDDQADTNTNGVGNACEVAPTATDDVASLSEGGTLNNASVLLNDVDAEGDTLVPTIVTGPSNASSFTLNNDGTFTYIHNGGETTSDSFTYQISDGALTATATVTLTIIPVDDPTVLVADTNAITENSIPNTVSGDLLANDSDLDTALTISNAAALTSNTAYGSLVVNSNGTYTYTLDNSNPAVIALINGVTLTEVFNYTSNSETQTLTITINGVDGNSVFSADTNSVTEDGTNPITGNVLTNDTDPDTVLVLTNSASLSGTGAYGSLTINSAGAYSYTLDNTNTTVNALDNTGSLTETYAYQVNGNPATTLTITINGADDATVLNADTASITEDSVSILGNVLTNDTDPDTTLTVSNATALSGTGIYGSIAINSAGAFTYTLDNTNATVNNLVAGGSLTEIYAYISNGQSSSLTITINGNDDAAQLVVDTNSIAEDSGATVSGNVLSNDSDSDSPLTVTNVAAINNSGAFGTLTIDSTGAYSYTLDNSNTLVNGLNTGSILTETYTYNANGLSSTLSITITGADDAASVTADVAVITEDVTPSVSGNILTNDSDPDTSLSVDNAAALNGSGTYGSLSIGVAGAYTYTLDNSNSIVNGLNTGSILIETYNYVANGLSSTLTITISGTDDPASLTADVAVITEDVTPSISGNILTNDSDPDTSLSVDNAAALNGSGTYGSLSIGVAGAYTYTLDNNNSTVNALNTGDSLTETYAYTANGVNSSLTITINGTTDAATVYPNVQGTWQIQQIVSNVTFLNGNTQCSEAVGDNWNSYLSIVQTGSTFTAVGTSGANFTGTVDAAGNLSIAGSWSGAWSDASTPTSTGTTNYTDTITGTATTTDSAMTGSYTDILSSDGSGVLTPVCDIAFNYTASKVYTRTGSEDYNGIYTLEVENDFQTPNGSDGITGIPYTVEVDFSGGSLELHSIGEGQDCVEQTSNGAYDATTGAFSIEFENNCVHTSDNTSERKLQKLTGLFVRAPSETTLPSMSFEMFGVEREYDNANYLNGTQTYVSSDEVFGYGKKVVTRGYTRTNNKQKGNNKSIPSIAMGLLEPTLRKASPTGKLYLEVLDGATSLCAVPFVSTATEEGKFKLRGHVRNNVYADFANEVFSADAYSFISCNTSLDDGTARVFDNNTYTVRVIDAGANGNFENGSGDDVEINSRAVIAAVNASPFTSTLKRKDLRINGARVSASQTGKPTPVWGFFDSAEPQTLSWTNSTFAETADEIQVRVQEIEENSETQTTLAVNATSVVLPAAPNGLINHGPYTIQLRHKRDLAGARSYAIAAKVEVQPGVRGLFNIELGDAFANNIFQVWLNGDYYTLNECDIQWNLGDITCTGGSINMGDNSVTMNLTDDNGFFTGTPGQTFNLTLHFTDANSAEVTSSFGITGVPFAPVGVGATTAAEVAVSEFFVRTQRYSHRPNDLTGLRTRFNFNDLRASVWDKAVLTPVTPVANSNFFKANGTDSGTSSYTIWDNSAPATHYVNSVNEFNRVPANDGIAQPVKLFTAITTEDIFGTGFGKMETGAYKVTLTDSSGVNAPLEYRFKYSGNIATNMIAPSVSTGDTITLNATACTLASCNNNNVVSIPSLNSLSWNVGSVPASAYWRIVIREFVGGVNLVGEQQRTAALQDGDFGLSIVGGVATWTNPGGYIFVPGKTYSIQLLVHDTKNGWDSKAFGSTSRELNGDWIYFRVPGV